MIKKNPHIAWAALCSIVEGGVSRPTLRKYLGKNFRRKWKALKKIQLTPELATKRLIYAQENINNIATLMEIEEF